MRKPGDLEDETNAIPFVNTILILLLTFPADAWPTRAHNSNKRFNFIMLMTTLVLTFVVSKVEEIMRGVGWRE